MAYYEIPNESETILNGVILDDETMDIKDGGTANNTVAQHGYINIYSGGTANNTTLTDNGFLYVHSSAAANKVTIESGFLDVYSGGTATEIEWTPCVGEVTVKNGAHVTFASVHTGVFYGSSGQVLENAATMDDKSIGSGYLLYVMSDGIANNATVDSYGKMHVCSGGTANKTEINSAGDLHLSSGGTADSATVNNGGYLWTFSGGTANCTTVNASGHFNLSGGIADGVTLNSQGYFALEDGGKADKVKIGNGGILTVFSGGSAKVAEWTPGLGHVELHADGEVTFASEYSGVYYGNGNNLISSAAEMADINLYASDYELYVMDGGKASKTTVNENAYMAVFSGGSADSTTVIFWGGVFVNDGGKAEHTTIESYGSLCVNSGGTANNTTVNYGGLFEVFGSADSATVNTSGVVHVSSGGKVTNTTLNARGYMSVYGATLDVTTVNSSGMLYIHENAKADHTTVSCGSMYVYGSAKNTVMNEGELYVREGGKATIAMIDNSIAKVESGGEMTGATVQHFGILEVYGTANNITVKEEGEFLVSGGASVDFATVAAGGRIAIDSGASATNIAVDDGAEFILTVAPDTYAQGTYAGTGFEVKDGAISGNTALYKGGLAVSSGGVATDITAKECMNIWLYNGGVVDGLTLDGGTLTVFEGGKITGKMRLTDTEGTSFWTYDGAIVDFDLTKTAPGNEVLVNNIAAIAGKGTFTITVDGMQDGTYKLAEGATYFSPKFDLAVVNPSGTELGTISVEDGTKMLGGMNYTLNLTDDLLSITVETPPATIVDPDGDVRLANTLPKARYMYGCCPTSVAMLLGYYDLYGYRGKDFSALIEGDVDVHSRGSGDEIYVMDDFDSVLGKATATKDFVYRFFSHDPLDVIIKAPDEATPTTPAEELPYSFVNEGAGPEIRTDDWNCLADYLGTGQFWRGTDEVFMTNYRIDTMLEQYLYDEDTETITDEDTGVKRTIESRYKDYQYGLYLYVQDKGYSLDMKVTATHNVDAIGGDFTFEDYMREIDAGRPVLVMIEGHVMTGYGYNAETKEIIFDDCYIEGRMAWDGTYDYSDEERKLEAIGTIGFITTDKVVDLAVTPVEGSAEKLVLATSEGRLVSDDYCFVGSPLYLSFAVSNLSEFASGAFNILIAVDDEPTGKIPPESLDGGESASEKDFQLGTKLGVGLHTIGVMADPDNRIQEEHALNNIETRAIMVLEEGTNVVEGIKTVGAGEVSADDYVMNGAEIHVLDGGTAEGTLIQGKVLEKSSGGKAVKTTPGIADVSAGGVARYANVYEYGKLQVSGRAEYVSVLDNGEATVSAGAAISDIAVNLNGTLKVKAGGKLTGQIRLEEGADVSFEDGAVLNFDLTQTSPGAVAFVNDLSVIRGKPGYTLTIDGTEEEGKYKLAGGAEKFDKTITVVNTSGTELGTLTVDETTEIGGVKYTLKLRDEEVFVRVGEPLNGPDDSWNDYLYDKSNKKDPWCPAFLSDSYVPNVLIPKDKELSELFLDEIGTIDYDDETKHHYDNFVGRIDSNPKFDGRKDAADYAKIELKSAAGLKFMIDSAINGKFNVYQVIYEDDGKTPKKVKSLISNGGKAVKKNNIAKSMTGALRLEAGTYYVSMTGTIAAKGDTRGFYNVFLAPDCRFYTDADDNANDYAYARTDKGKDDKHNLNPVLVDNAVKLTRDDIGESIQIDLNKAEGAMTNWVGFSDAVDYRMITLDSAALLSFTLTATDKAKLVIYEAKLSGKTGKWSLASKGSVTVNGTKVKSKSTSQKVLEKGTYFVMVKSTNASTGLGGNANYDVTLNVNSVFFDSADDGDNKWAYDKKKDPQINPALRTTTLAEAGGMEVLFDTNTMTAEGFSNFVGHNDKADYARVKVDSGTAEVQFKVVDTTGNATLAVYQLVGTKLKELDSVKITVGGANTTRQLSLAEGSEYFLSMTAKDTKKGSVYYNVLADVKSLKDASGAALAMPEDSLAMTDSLSFGQYDADALADASSAASLTELNDKSGWQSLLA